MSLSILKWAFNASSSQRCSSMRPIPLRACPGSTKKARILAG